MATPDIDEITDDLLRNADFEEKSSVAKAKAFVTAATRYLIASPQSASDQSSSLTINAGEIRDLLTRAQQYVAQQAARSNGTSVRFLSAAEGFRR